MKNKIIAAFKKLIDENNSDILLLTETTYNNQKYLSGIKRN